MGTSTWRVERGWWSTSVMAALTAWLMAALAAAAEPTGTFRLTLDPAVQAEVYAGRVYVALQRAGERGEPRTRMGDWMGGVQVLALEVAGVKPGEAIDVKAGALGYPAEYGAVPAGAYRVQAVARRNPDHCSPGMGAGDLCSDVETVDFEAGAAGVTALRLSRTVKARGLRESERVKLVEFESPLLSEFLGRPFTFRAGVMLPAGWKADGTDRFSTLYFVGGFGGDHTTVNGLGRMLAANPGADGAVIVVPDATCFRGHSVFADSATNGPWGRVFTEELVPEIERRFRAAATRERRFLCGMSSGGWSVLWLMTAYPDVFAGCWAHCPDPVDFRDFQRINLYAPGANMYVDAAGARRPLMRQGARVLLHYDDFVRQETVMGPGGQIHSFEAVFSPREHGVPRPLFDRATGAVDPVTAKAWEAFDINLVLERRWQELEPKLRGRIRVYAGEEDNFFLEGAARRLGETLARLKADATVEVIPGMGHSIHGPGIVEMFETIAKASE